MASSISEDSINITDYSDKYQDTVGHGTAVASIIAADRNSLGLVGVAPDAELVIVKASNAENSFTQSSLINALAYTTSVRTPIVNMSLATDSTLIAPLLEQMQLSLNDGTLIVTAAGNTAGDDPQNPALLATIDNSGALLAVGSVDNNNQISAFSNRAGDKRDFYLVAPGEEIIAAHAYNGTLEQDGTSIAAAFVSGAAAALLSKDPHLSGDELATILLTTAQDLGEAGVDEIYGHGLLRLDLALLPQGTLTIPDGGSIYDSSLEPAWNFLSDFNTAFNTANIDKAFNQVLALDDYNRSYTSDLSGDAPDYASDQAAALGQWGNQSLLPAMVASESDDGAHYLQLQDGGSLYFHQGDTYGDRLTARLGYTNAGTDSLSLATKLAPPSKTHEALGAKSSFNALMDQSAFAHLSFKASDKLKLVAQTRATPQSLSSQTEVGAISRASLGLEAEFDKAQVGVSIGQVSEKTSFLGAQIGDPLATFDQLKTKTVDANISYQANQTWGLEGSLSLGYSDDMAMTGVAKQVSDLTSTAGSLSLSAKNLGWQPKGRQSLTRFSVSQPLAVSEGSLAYDKPVERDIDGNIFREQGSISLAPDVRQLDLEARYGLLDLKAGSGFEAFSTLGLNPGNQKADPAVSLGLKYSLKF